MCGIIGTIGSKLDRASFEKARDSLAHRGPDDFGIFIDENAGAMLGHRRLSIIDLSQAGHQPMATSDRRYIITYNGEIYNYLELRDELKGQYEFKTKTDTEVLLAAYQVWGEKCLDKFNGMFAFAIWDTHEKKLFAARDRLGVKPFFYHVDGQKFSFASEIKALLALGVQAMPNENMIFDYLYHGLYDHTNETFFTGIQSLAPGHYMTWQNGELSTTKYWDAADIKLRQNIDEREARAELVNLLSDSIRLRFRSDMPVGVNLSSGLDSNSIYHFALKVTGNSLHTFSMCSNTPEYNECELLNRILSDEQKKYWHTSTLEPEEVIGRIASLNQIQDQPYGGIPTIAYQKMVELTKSAGVTVLLEGQGMDELLAGYAYYRNPVSSIALSQDASQLVQRDVLDVSFVRRHGARKEVVFPTPFASDLLNAQYRDMRYTKLPRVLRFNDHATMAHGRELRLPFLDYRIVEFCFSLPVEYKIRDGRQKVILRDVMAGIVPEEVQATPKKGFGAIQTAWFREHLKGKVYAILDSESFKKRPFWDQTKLRESVDAFYSGKGDNSFFIWQCFNLEMWFKEYID
ncbi:MAG: asparagine synthase (glutamine-hydrolyzing) [Patescibacteria group bacterium]